MKKIISKYRHIWRELPVRQRKPAFEAGLRLSSRQY